MAIVSTVMGPDETQRAQHLKPSPLSPSLDKLRLRKAARCLATPIRACEGGGDTRAKGVLAALGMLLFRSLPPSRIHLVDKYIESGELVLDPNEVWYTKIGTEIVESVIKIIAESSASNLIKRLYRISKGLYKCRSFLLGESNMAMVLLANANRPQQTFSSVMANLV